MDFGLKKFMYNLSFEDIKIILERGLVVKKNICIVCKKNIADALIDFVEELDYDCENVFLGDDEIQYFTVYFDRESTYPDFYCENARVDGEFKISDLDNIDYLICVDINQDIARKKFFGCSESSLRWVNIDDTFYDIYEDEDELYCECDDCEECMEECFCEECMEECSCDECMRLDEYIDFVGVEQKDKMKLKLKLRLDVDTDYKNFHHCKKSNIIDYDLFSKILAEEKCPHCIKDILSLVVDIVLDSISQG